MGENGREPKLVIELTPEEAAGVHGVHMLHLAKNYPPYSKELVGLTALSMPLWSYHATFANPALSGTDLGTLMAKIGHFAVTHGIGKELGIDI